MSGYSSYLRKSLFDAALRGSIHRGAARLYLALYTSDPTENDQGSEVVGEGYFRQEIAFGELDEIGNGFNVNAITFPVAKNAWGDVTHYGIRDEAQGGNLLFFGKFDEAPFVLNRNTRLEIPIGFLSVSVING